MNSAVHIAISIPIPMITDEIQLSIFMLYPFHSLSPVTSGCVQGPHHCTSVVNIINMI